MTTDCDIAIVEHSRKVRTALNWSNKMSNKNSDGHYRSAISGRYVTEKHGKASPNTTVKEASGAHGSSGEHYRSAISGQYVTTKHGESHPRTTVKNS